MNTHDQTMQHKKKHGHNHPNSGSTHPPNTNHDRTCTQIMNTHPDRGKQKKLMDTHPPQRMDAHTHETKIRDIHTQKTTETTHTKARTYREKHCTHTQKHGPHEETQTMHTKTHK